APHAAGVAALLRQALPNLTPAEIRDVLEDTAQNIGVGGFATSSGFGRIRAASALNALHAFSITAGPSGTPNPVASGGAVSLGVTAADAFGHALTFAWTSTCTGGLGPGRVDDATAPAPTWTASTNTTGVSQTCALKVTVGDGHGFIRIGTHTETVLSVAHITTITPAMAAVGTSVTITGTSLAGATG